MAMADEHDSAQQNIQAVLAGLTNRVFQLERELDALKRGTPLPTREPQPTPPPPPPRATWSQPPIAAVPAQPFQAASESPAPISDRQSSSSESLENKLGAKVFNLVGLVVIIIAAALFLKLAIDNGWLGPLARVVVGLVAGAGLVLWSERFRAKGFAAFSYSLKALGSGILYLSLWAAFHLYALLPAEAAFALMVLVTAWNAWMAWAQDSQLLAAYALAGGFLTPVLLSTGGNHEVFLFSYLLIIDLATIALVRLKPWPRLLLGAFPLTVLFFAGWYSENFHPYELAVTSLFIVLFDCAFSSVPIRPRATTGEAKARNRSTLIQDILLPLANSAFLGLALYSVLQDSGHHDLLPWLMVVLAAVYLGFMRLPQTAVASAIHLSIGIVFLTIAVPLKASGHWITVSWLVEGLALTWVASRLTTSSASADEETPEEKPDDAGKSYASATLRLLGSASLALGFCGIFAHEIWAGLFTPRTFFNSNTATAVIGILVFAAVAWLCLRSPSDPTARKLNWPVLAVVSFLAIDCIAVLLASREVVFSWNRTLHAPLQTPEFLSALLALAVFAAVLFVSLRIAATRTQPGTTFWPTSAGLAIVAFNLIAVLTGVREIVALFPVTDATGIYTAAPDVDAALKQALAISAYLMLYGAALLALGFWKRSAFVRWQALGLLVFTIFKTFLYDMRNLSQGYRVVSFLGLGVVLMTISFAYQKDWLGLRQPAPPDPAPHDSEAAQ
jgi:uncharacterized membrane protein